MGFLKKTWQSVHTVHGSRSFLEHCFEWPARETTAKLPYISVRRRDQLAFCVVTELLPNHEELPVASGQSAGVSAASVP